ncbi:SGNH/GDSL hydrolase family protein [Kribbella sp. NBC_01505]|uniref:SGNH/GDSL hydrolase family protein n=1 Tax=Kribbella sp. NBC_01505 TaxID=2903580 RepID=UPI00386CE502
MPSPKSRRLPALAATVLTLLAFTTVPAEAAPPAKVPVVNHYVALGDSFTAGPLIPWQSASWCFRSNNNYPSWLATKLGIYYTSGAFEDVSCSSATTAHMTQPQTVPDASIPLTTEPPQFDALTLDTDLVTIGIGGNDAGVFGHLVYDCPTYRSSDPTGAPCKKHYTVNGVDTLLAAVAQTEKNVERVVAGARKRSPGAKILVIGYPRLLPPTGYCPSVMPFADGDYRYLDQVERALNAALSKAAKAKGATYVDTYAPSLGHDACAGDAAWVNGQYTNLLQAVSYHPFEEGMEGIASIIYNVLSGAPAGAADTRPVAPRTSHGTALTPQQLAHRMELAPIGR